MDLQTPELKTQNSKLKTDGSLPPAAVDALLDLSDAAARSTRPDDLLQRIVATAADLVAQPWAALMLRDPASHDVRLVATHGVALADLPAVLQRPSPDHVNPALFTGGPFSIEDYQ